MTEGVHRSWRIPRALSSEVLRLLTSLPMDEIERRLSMEPAAIEGQPSDEKLLCIAAEAIDGYGNGIEPGQYESSTECAVEAYGSELCAFARAVLARWGNQQPRPIPVSERQPGDQLCWWFESDDDCGYGSTWTLLRIRGSATGYTHWLPANALPLPEAQS